MGDQSLCLMILTIMTMVPRKVAGAGIGIWSLVIQVGLATQNQLRIDL